jgi:hypothetical protein
MFDLGNFMHHTSRDWWDYRSLDAITIMEGVGYFNPVMLLKKGVTRGSIIMPFLLPIT